MLVAAHWIVMAMAYPTTTTLAQAPRPAPRLMVVAAHSQTSQLNRMNQKKNLLQTAMATVYRMKTTNAQIP